MTGTAVEAATGAGSCSPRWLHLRHLRVGPAAGPTGNPRTWRPDDLDKPLAPFVAWLGTQAVDESAREQHRDAVRRFLRWNHDDVETAGSRRRYTQHLKRHDPRHLPAARAGLRWWAVHRWLMTLTPRGSRP